MKQRKNSMKKNEELASCNSKMAKTPFGPQTQRLQVTATIARTTATPNKTKMNDIRFAIGRSEYPNRDTSFNS